MSVEAASVHSSIFWIDDTSRVPGCEVDGGLASLFWFRALMRGEEGERWACSHRVLAAGMLLPQILCNNAVQRRGRGQVSVKLLLHSWTLAEGPVVRLLPQNSGFLAGHHAATCLAFTGENDPSDEW